MQDALSPEIIRFLLVFSVTFLAHYIARRAFKHAESIAFRTNNILDDSLISAARRPLPVLIWLAGFSFALHFVHRPTGEQLHDFLNPARYIGAVLCIAWFLFALIRELADNVVAARTQSGEEVDRTTVDGLSKISRIVVVVVAALAVLQTLGFSISGVLAFGGMGGIAVGFAAKDLLANLFGGLMVHLDRPFNVGETIRSPDRQIEGKVEYIGWRQTRIRSLDMSLIYVPNSLFASIVVENPSRMSHRRIREVIGLRYEDIGKMSAIISEVNAMLIAHHELDNEQTRVVAFDQFADSSLNFFIHCFTLTSDFAHFHEVKQDVLLKTADIIARHQAHIAFPTRTLHMPQA